MILPDLSPRSALKALALLASAALLAACAPGTGAGSRPSAGIVTQPQADRVDPSGPVRVAVLAPLGTGDASREARAQGVINGVEMALADAGSRAIEIEVYATREDPATAAAAATRAISEGASLIIGPVFSGSTSAVSAAVAGSGVPVLSLSNNPSVAGGGTYILGQSFENGAARLMQEAANTGLRRVGLVTTSDVEGQVATDAVRRAASRWGVQLATQTSYPRSQNGIADSAQSYTNALNAAGVDAIVMSDRGGGLVYAASFLPYYGLNLDGVQMMSLNPLVDVEFRREQTFAGAWYPAPDPGAVQSFTARYTSRFGPDTGGLSNVAYDAAAATISMLVTARETGDRTPFDAQAVANPRGFQGAYGAFRIRSDGGTDRALAIMEVTPDGPVLRSGAPGGFGFTGS